MFGLSGIQLVQIICGVLAVVGLIVLVLRHNARKK